MKVLVAEDEPVARHLLTRLLTKWGYDVTSVPSGDAAWEVLDQDHSFTLAIFDWMMPGSDGVEIVRRLRAADDRPYTYVLLLTAKNEKSEALHALNAGCDDYITKPFDPEELRARLLVGKRIVDLQTQLTHALQVTHHQATHDALTGVFNRRAILDVLGQEIDRSRRADIPLSIALADIDHFKSVNDTYGHIIGDEVLRALTERIMGLIRSYDRLGRFGGEEFLIVFPECGSQEALASSERVRKGVANTQLRVADLSLPATLSMGLATLDSSSDVESLLSEADEALYLAKENGRNQVRVVDRREISYEGVVAEGPNHAEAVSTSP